MYYIVYGLLWLLSLIPLRILYLFSDLIYGLLYYVMRYRRDVVTNNLLIAFPEKTDAEREKIAKKFYHNMVDTFIETIKMLSVSKKFLSRHFSGNWEVINNLKSTGKSVQFHLGHNFNWEWCNAVGGQQFNMPFVVVYMPIVNKIFERLIYYLRSRYGTLLVKATRMKEEFLPFRNKQYILGLAADQTPGDLKKGRWVQFFGRPTLFVKGPAKIAIFHNSAVVFAFIKKIKRGKYEIVFSLTELNPAGLTEQDLTTKFVVYLEGVIRKYPDMWLWSHRRWKHEWKEEYGPYIKTKNEPN